MEPMYRSATEPLNQKQRDVDRLTLYVAVPVLHTRILRHTQTSTQLADNTLTGNQIHHRRESSPEFHLFAQH